MTVHPFSSDVTLERRKERVAGWLASSVSNLKEKG
jgi:hypothetical protein